MAEKTLVENVAPHSVQLTVNAKGKVQIEVKVYDSDPMEAAVKAQHTLEHLERQFGARLPKE